MESPPNRPQPPTSIDGNEPAAAMDRVAAESTVVASTTQTTQNVKGERNQVIGSVSGGTVVANVETLNQYIQQALPRFLSKHQLPPDIADFTGRQRQQETILATLRPADSQNLVAISGMAGAGKSALAIRVAHQLTAEWDEVQLYCNLRGAEDHQAVDPATVLLEWLRALGLDDASIPAELDGRVAAYRSLLQGKRAIVLLDNAQNEAQIRPLLPNSSSCAVLITSRKKLVALQGVSFLELPLLPENEALSLLKTLIGSSRVEAELEAAKAMLVLCGQLPLAIRIAAGSLNKSSQQRTSLAEYVRKLRDEKQRLKELHLDHLAENLDVRTSFNLSYRELSHDLAGLFRWLGLLEAPDFGVAVAAVLIEADKETAQQRIDALIDAQLLEAVSENRYRFHDLIRLFAREQLEHTEPPEHQVAAQQRVIQHFLEWSDITDACLRPDHRRQIAQSWIADNPTLVLEQVERGLEQGALAWFEEERSTLLTLAKWSSEAQTWEHLSALSGNLALFLDRRSYWLDAEQLHLQALHATRQLGDVQGEGRTLNNLGNVYRSQGKWDEAISCYEQDLQIRRSLGDVHGEGLSLNNLGNVYYSQGKWDEAISCYEQSLQIRRSLSDVQGEGTTLNNLGVVYYSQGKWDEAISCYEQDLQIRRSLGDVQGEGLSLNNLGAVYYSQGKWDEAISCYEQSLQIRRSLSDVQGEGTTLNGLGAVYRSQGKWDEAISCYEQSLQTFRSLGDVHGEGTTLNNLGTVYRSQGKWDEAISCYEQSLQICRSLGDVHGEGQTLNNLGNVYRSQGKWDEAISCYEQSLQIKRSLGDVHGEGTTLNNLGTVYRSQGKWDEAISCYEQSLQICRSLGDVHGEGTTLNNLGTVYDSQGKWDEAISCYEQSLQIKRSLGDVHGEGTTLNNLGTVYRSQGKWDEAISCYEQDLQICRSLGDVHGEGQTLVNLGLLYQQQNQLNQAMALWQEALTKLHPDSPEFRQLSEMLQAVQQPHRSNWLGWLLPLGVLLFLGWNLIKGHWLIALLGVLALVGWQWYRKRRTNR